MITEVLPQIMSGNKNGFMFSRSAVFHDYLSVVSGFFTL